MLSLTWGSLTEFSEEQLDLVIGTDTTRGRCKLSAKRLKCTITHWLRHRGRK